MNFQIMTKLKSASNRLLAYNPNLAQSWLLFGIFILCHLAEFTVRAIMQHVVALSPEWSSLSGDVAKYIALALFVIRLSKHGNDISVVPAKPSPLLWFLLVPFTLSISITVNPLTSWIPQPDFVKQMFADMHTINLPAFLSIVVVAAVCEEWLCRGIILKGMLKHYSPRKAILWSSVLFSIFHLNPWQGVTAFFLGLAIGWIYWRTRSLRYCVFMHMVNNATAFLILFLLRDTPEDTSLAVIAGGYYIYAVTFLLCVLCVLGIRKLLKTVSYSVQI